MDFLKAKEVPACYSVIKLLSGAVKPGTAAVVPDAVS
jgi:hypothetical protein